MQRRTLSNLRRFSAIYPDGEILCQNELNEEKTEREREKCDQFNRIENYTIWIWFDCVKENQARSENGATLIPLAWRRRLQS